MIVIINTNIWTYCYSIFNNNTLSRCNNCVSIDKHTIP